MRVLRYHRNAHEGRLLHGHRVRDKVTGLRLLSAPVISGTFTIGQTLSATNGTWSETGLSFAPRWTRNGQPIPGATSATYELVEADDGQTIGFRIVASKGGETALGTATGAKRAYAAPVAGSLDNVSLTEASPQTLIDVRSAFTGSGLAYSLVSPPTGVTISGHVVSIRPDLTGTLTDETITVRATNAAGNDDATFNLSVGISAPVLDESIPAQSFSENNGTQTVATADAFAGTVTTYSLVSPPTGVTINSGTGVVSVNTATSGLMSGVTIRVRATNASGSVDATFSLTVTVSAPSTTGSIDAKTYTRNDGEKTFASAGAFTGSQLVYSLPGNPTGVTINVSTGLVTVDTAATPIQSATSITVRATNASGFSTVTFALTIESDQEEEDSAYAGAPGVEPPTVIDTVNNVYWKNGEALAAQHELVENRGATKPSDMAPVIHSDGNLSWPLHNLVTAAALAGAASVAIEDTGVEYTLAFMGTGSIDITGGATDTLEGTGAEDLVSTTFTPSDDIDLDVTGTVTSVRVYRSDLPIQPLGPAGDPTYLATTDAPRFALGVQHSSDLVPIGIPLFPARTNLVEEAIITTDNAGEALFWDTNSVTVAAADVSALGLFPGVSLASEGAVWNRVEMIDRTFEAGKSYAVTILSMPGSAIEQRLTFKKNGNDQTQVAGEFGSKTVFFQNGGAGQITDLREIEYPDGTIRLSCVWTCDFTSSAWKIGFGPQSDNAGDDVIFCFIQIEEADRPGPLILNDGAARTRPAAVAWFPTAGTGFVPGQGTILASASLAVGDEVANARVVQLDDGTDDNAIGIEIDPNTDKIHGRIRAGGSPQVDVSASFGYNSVFVFEDGAFAFAADNSDVASADSGTIPTVDRVRLGASAGGTSYLSGYLKTLGLFPPIDQSNAKALTVTSIPGSAPVTPTAPGFAASPSIFGSPTIGNTLSLSLPAFTGTLPISVDPQWLFNGEDIDGAVNSTFDTDNQDFIDGEISCRVVITNAVGSAQATTNAILIQDVGQVAAPINVTPPVLTGGTGVGATVTCSDGEWTGEDIEFVKRWRLDGVIKEGVVGDTYVLAEGDVDGDVDCLVFAINDGGEVPEPTSNQITVEETPAPFAALKTHTVAANPMTPASKYAGTLAGGIGWSILLQNPKLTMVNSAAPHREHSSYNGGTTFADACACRPYPGAPINLNNESLEVVVFDRSMRIRKTDEYPAITKNNIVVAGETAPAPGVEVIDSDLFIAGRRVMVGHIAGRPGRVDQSSSAASNTDGIAVRARNGNRYFGDIVDNSEQLFLYHLSVQGGSDEGYTTKADSGTAVKNLTWFHCHYGFPLHNTGNDEHPHIYGWYNLKRCEKTEFVGNALVGCRHRGAQQEGGHGGYGSLVMAGNLVIGPRDGRNPNTESDLCKKPGQGPMTLNLFHFANGDVDMVAIENVAYWPSSLFLNDENGDGNSGYRGSYGGGKLMDDHIVRAYRENNKVRNWRTTDTLANESGVSGGPSWWSEEEEPPLVPSNRYWGNDTLVGGRTDVERYVPLYSGKMPAARDALDTYMWQLALHPDNNKLLPFLGDIPHPTNSSLAWKDYDWPTVIANEPFTPVENHWELHNDVPRVLWQIHDNYHVGRAGGVPFLF